MTQVALIGVGTWLAVDFVVVALFGRLITRRRVSPRFGQAATADPFVLDSQLVSGQAASTGPSTSPTDGYASILLARLVVQTCRIVGTEQAVLFVREAAPAGELIAVAAHGLDEDVIGERVSAHGELGRAIRAGACVGVDQASVLGAFHQGSCVATPAVTRSGRMLALCVATTDPTRTVGQREHALLAMAAGLCSAAVDDVAIKNGLAWKVRAVGDTLARSGSEGVAGPRSPIGKGSLATRLGIRLGLEPGALIELELAARAVCGVISSGAVSAARPAGGSMRERCCASPGGVDTREIAARVALLPGFEAVALIVEFLGERWDGLGLPHGQRGDRIPLASRILAGCNALRALTTDTPYGLGVPLEQGLRRMQADSGTVFDPAVIAALSQELLGEAALLDETPAAAGWGRADAQYLSVRR